MQVEVSRGPNVLLGVTGSQCAGNMNTECECASGHLMGLCV